MPFTLRDNLDADPLAEHLRSGFQHSAFRDVLKPVVKHTLLGTAIAALGPGGVLLPQSANAQANYSQQTGEDNPASSISVDSKSTPVAADVDGDNDADLVVGQENGSLSYYENTGSSTSPSYTERTGSENPFDGVGDVVSGSSVPALGDVDSDGDLDLVVGRGDGTLSYFENTGSATSPSYTERVGFSNPFGDVDVSDGSAPGLGDVDRDGDLDVAVGQSTSSDSVYVAYYENTGGSADPSYTERTGEDNPFAPVAGDLTDVVPRLGDIDKDGDLDLVTGKEDGTMGYYENIGSATNPEYENRAGDPNPFEGYGSGDNEVNSAPGLADLDGDGDLDAFSGRANGSVDYLEEVGDLTRDEAYSEASDDPFEEMSVPSNAVPTEADLDGDGDRDLVVGTAEGTLRYFENTGSAEDPAYTERTGADNPFDGVDAGDNSAPELADVDRDGDLDAAVGRSDGTVAYFENTGSATDPSFTEQTGEDNPFSVVDGDLTDSVPRLGDIDSDGDLDLVNGKEDGSLGYYENIGSATSPEYENRTGGDNPFDGINVGEHSMPALRDVDADGDLDAVVGRSDGTLVYLEHDGAVNSPTYTQQSGADNPFNGIDAGDRSAPTLGDLEADSDFDAVIGSGEGALTTYQYGDTDALPVELTQFRARRDGEQALLTWSTASEVNNSGFEVQRMLGDAGSGMFEVLGFVEGAGTADQPQAYRFRTTELSPGMHRFRLKQVDLDGSAEYSETRSVEIRIGTSYRLVAPSPNPTSGDAQMRLTVRQSQHVTVSVFDVLGRRVKTVFDGTLSAQQEEVLRFGDRLATGAYFIEIDGDEFHTTRKLTIVE